jgi:hypothetical protein
MVGSACFPPALRDAFVALNHADSFPLPQSGGNVRMVARLHYLPFKFEHLFAVPCYGNSILLGSDLFRGANLQEERVISGLQKVD